MQQQKSRLQLCLELFCCFFKIGMFTFGGGYAMIPIMQREVVETKRWISEDDVLDMLAIAESTPGVLAVNAATFTGYKMAGIMGSALATLGVVMPSFLIISLLALFLEQVRDFRWVGYAFAGIRAGVVVLMFNAVLKLSRHCPKNAFTYILAAAGFVLTALLDVNIFLVLILAALVGLVRQLLLAKEHGKEEK